MSYLNRNPADRVGAPTLEELDEAGFFRCSRCHLIAEGRPEKAHDGGVCGACYEQLTVECRACGDRVFTYHDGAQLRIEAHNACGNAGHLVSDNAATLRTRAAIAHDDALRKGGAQ